MISKFLWISIYTTQYDIWADKIFRGACNLFMMLTIWFTIWQSKSVIKTAIHTCIYTRSTNKQMQGLYYIFSMAIRRSWLDIVWLISASSFFADHAYYLIDEMFGHDLFVMLVWQLFLSVYINLVLYLTAKCSSKYI